MDQLKNINNNHSTSASSAIQSAIDDLSAIKTNKNTSSPNTTSNTTALSSTPSTSSTHQSTALSSIDSTLNALGDQYPFSEHRARPHSSNLSSHSATTQTAKNAELARTLGSFGTPGLNNLNNLNNPLSPSALTTHPAYNPLTHWGSVSSLRNPYPTYGAPRNATKASIANTNDNKNNPRKKSYEDKMDKQRLEHILFSGDQSGPLNQQKERMRQKLQKKQANKQNKGKAKHKKTQPLPNTSAAAHGLLQLDAAKKQKANGDNGYFLTEINSKSPNKSTINHTNSSTNKKKKNRGNQRRAKSQRQIKKKVKKQNPKKKKKTQKKKQQNTKTDSLPQTQKTTEGVVNHKLDECNQAFGEQSKQPNHKDYADQLPGDILNQQRDVFEQEPDEYFNDHDIAPLMQNKLKLELNQQISGISIWRDKKELEPLLNNGGYNNNQYSTNITHKNENPNLLSPTQHTHNLTDDDEDDPFVDNFVNVGDSDNEHEGVAKNKVSNHSNLSSNSNDSDNIEIFIDKNDRVLIEKERDSEPGSAQNVNNEFQYEGINSNVDLIKYQESLRNGTKNEDEEDRSRRNSTTLLDSSQTTQVDGGFDVNAEDEEKHIEAPKKAQEVVFDAKGVERPKEVQFVQEESDADRDLFENMQIKEAQASGREAEGTNKGEQMNALEKVLKAVGKKAQNSKQEEEREKDVEDNKSGSNVAATWVKIKNMSNQQQGEKYEGVKNDKHEHKKNEKKNEKKSENKKNKKKKKNNNDAKQKKNKQQPKAEKKRKQKENKKNAKKQNKTNHVKDEDATAQKTDVGEITLVDKEEKENKSNDKKAPQNLKTKQSQNKKKDKDKSNEKKRKKRTKKKKSNKTKQQKNQVDTEKGEKNGEISHHKDTPKHNVDKDVSDDDTTTIDSSSNAPSSIQDPNADEAQDNDGGWIIKGNKNKNNKSTKRNNRRESNRNNNNQSTPNNVSSPRTNNNKDASTPMSSKSSNSKKSSFAYSDAMEVTPKANKDKESKKKNKKHHKDSNKNKPQIKKSKSVTSADNHHNNKSTNRIKNRKERRQSNRINRQKSDSLLMANKYPSSTIVVPSRHSKTIHTSMILPKSTHAATSDPLTKHNYPPLKAPHNKKVHFKDTNHVQRVGKVKQQPNINVNLSVLQSPTTPTSATLKNECSSSTPHSIHSDGDHTRHPRPTRPPITRLTNNPSANNTPNNTIKKDNNNVSTPTTALANSQSDHLMDAKQAPSHQQKPPLLTQRSAPLAGTSSPLNNNVDLTYNISPNSCGNDQDQNSNHINNNNHNNMLPQATNNSLITANGTNPTHMALYVDESGNLHETPLTLPDIFPAGLAPTSIPNVLGPLGAISLPQNNTDPSNNNSGNNTESGDKAAAALAGIPVLSVTGLAPPPQPSALGLTAFLPNLAGLPPLTGGVPNVPLPSLAGVAPLNTIPHTIPILLPMPQFTPEQMANLSKLNMVPKVAQTQTQPTKSKSGLQPIVAAFKPMKSKSKKLEQIKEHETMDSNIDETQTKCNTRDKEKESKQDIECNDNEEEHNTQVMKDEEKNQSKEEREHKKKKVEDLSNNLRTTRTKDSSVQIIAHFTPKSDKECLETLKNDLIEDEKDDEWIEIADLDATVYPATLWCLHVNKWSAHPQCSLKKLQQSMASALLSS